MRVKIGDDNAKGPAPLAARDHPREHFSGKEMRANDGVRPLVLYESPQSGDSRALYEAS
jgi:hypothetical protein